MANNNFDKGVTSAIMHFLFGALFGAGLFSSVVWMFFAMSLFIPLATVGALIFGVAAAIWRDQFWATLANNPLFRAWRAL